MTVNNLITYLGRLSTLYLAPRTGTLLSVTGVWIHSSPSILIPAYLPGYSGSLPDVRESPGLQHYRQISRVFLSYLSAPPFSDVNPTGLECWDSRKNSNDTFSFSPNVIPTGPECWTWHNISDLPDFETQRLAVNYLVTSGLCYVVPSYLFSTVPLDLLTR